MTYDVEVNKPSDHLLILRVVFFCFFFKEFNARLTQCDRDLNVVLFERQLLWRRQKIIYHAKIT
jgi:hypothetical protein